MNGTDAYDLARHFGTNLARVRRKRAGISQEELSFRASVHRTEIGMLERGIRIPRIDTLVKIAGGLEVAPDELLEGLTWSPPDGRTVGRFGARSTDDD